MADQASEELSHTAAQKVRPVMYLVTAEEMRRMEQKVISEVGIPALLLMENAGRAVAAEVAKQAQQSGQRWLVLVGKGNNGGDGLVAARHMAEAGLDVELVYAVPKERLQGEALVQRKIVEQLGFPEIPLEAFLKEKAGGKWDGIVDALLGTGTKGNPQPPYASLINWANDSRLPVVSVDIPSGVNVDSGAVFNPCIQADVTVTFACKKRGLLQFPAASFAGEVVVYPIQIPAHFAWKAGCRTFEVSDELLKQRFQLSPVDQRKEDTHKGTYGHVLVAAGSERMLGAGLLCTQAALRGGSGLVSWALPGKTAAFAAGRIPEAMLTPLTGEAAWESVPADALLDLLPQRDALVIGPGLGRWTGDSAWLRRIWEGAGDTPLVVDADALNMIADAPDFARWAKREAPTILTPHPGEMARLTGSSVPEVQKDRYETARCFALEHGVTLVLKGARTVTATRDGFVYVNVNGNPGMAAGGTGDALAGLIGALLAQGLSAKEAAVLGVFRHGAAGDRAAAARHNPASLLASDLIEAL